MTTTANCQRMQAKNWRDLLPTGVGVFQEDFSTELSLYYCVYKTLFLHIVLIRYLSWFKIYSLVSKMKIIPFVFTIHFRTASLRIKHELNFFIVYAALKTWKYSSISFSCTCSITSGAIQQGVPTKVCLTFSREISLPVANHADTPKSAICTVPSSPKRILPALISLKNIVIKCYIHDSNIYLWIWPLLWKYSSPLSTSLRTVAIVASSKTPCLQFDVFILCLIISKRLPPKTNNDNINNTVSSTRFTCIQSVCGKYFFRSISFRLKLNFRIKLAWFSIFGVMLK